MDENDAESDEAKPRREVVASDRKRAAVTGWSVSLERPARKQLKPKGGIPKSARVLVLETIARIEQRGLGDLDLQPLNNDPDGRSKIRIHDDADDADYRLPCLVDYASRSVRIDDIVPRNQMRYR